jgi:TM2 domain-containing membrane protein YozV
MDYWIIIPLILFTLGFVGTHLEIKRLEKEIIKLKKKKK